MTTNNKIRKNKSEAVNNSIKGIKEGGNHKSPPEDLSLEKTK